MSTTPRVAVPDAPVGGPAGFRDPMSVFPQEVRDLRMRLLQLAGIPRASPGSIDLDPVLAELIRLMNAAVQDCRWCSGGRNAYALERGLDAAMEESLHDVEHSDLPESWKAALLYADYYMTRPKDLPEDLRERVRSSYSADQVVELTCYCMALQANKTFTVLGLDPGPVQAVFAAEDAIYVDEPAEGLL